MLYFPDCVSYNVYSDWKGNKMSLQALEIDDKVFIGGVRGRGGHGAYMVVTKVNKKSVEAVEVKGSYKPGTPWKLYRGTELAFTTYDGSRVDPERGLITGLMVQKWRYLGEAGELKLYRD